MVVRVNIKKNHLKKKPVSLHTDRMRMIQKKLLKKLTKNLEKFPS
jgi:hypothetical protein